MKPVSQGSKYSGSAVEQHVAHQRAVAKAQTAINTGQGGGGAQLEAPAFQGVGAHGSQGTNALSAEGSRILVELNKQAKYDKDGGGRKHYRRRKRTKRRKKRSRVRRRKKRKSRKRGGGRRKRICMVCLRRF